MKKVDRTAGGCYVFVRVLNFRQKTRRGAAAPTGILLMVVRILPIAVLLLLSSAAWAETVIPCERVSIPLQDFTEEDRKRFPPELLRQIREKEGEWGRVLCRHRKQYEDYYRHILGPGIHSTWDVFLRERERMAMAGYELCEGPVVARKRIQRFPDRVWVASSYLPALAGKPVEQLRLLCYRFGRLQVVPYDIDEGTEDGTKIFTHGPENNAHLADHRFNHTDQLVFLAHDSGDRIDPQFIRDRFGSAVSVEEIELEDPVNGAKGWLYLCHFPENPPPKSAFDYISFFNETVNQQFTDYVWHQGTFSFKKGRTYRKIFCRGWKYAPFFGYTGDEFVDRLKMRIDARLCFGLVKFHFDEDDALGDWLAWKDGQVLASGRGWIAFKLPLGLESPRLIFDVVASETLLNTPFDIHVPFNPGRLLTDYSMKIGTDFSMAGHEIGQDNGYRFYNSNNPNGVNVNGVMEEEEKAWNAEKDTWRLITGPAGTIGFRSLWDSKYAQQADIRVLYVDDVHATDPPEFDAGQVGMHYSLSRVKSLKAGDYKLLLEWYGPPHFWNPDPAKTDWGLLRQYLNVLDHPVWIRAGGHRGENPAPCLRYRTRSEEQGSVTEDRKAGRRLPGSTVQAQQKGPKKVLQ